MDELLVEQRGPITLFTLNRPDAHNSITAGIAVGLAEGIDAFAADDSARVLVITGAGDKAFCSGANLKDVGELLTHAHTESAGPIGFAKLDPGKPTIAAVNGYCFAGGMELACWCDFRIASANAEFGALNRRWSSPPERPSTGRSNWPNVSPVTPRPASGPTGPPRWRPGASASTPVSTWKPASAAPPPPIPRWPKACATSSPATDPMRPGPPSRAGGRAAPG